MDEREREKKGPQFFFPLSGFSTNKKPTQCKNSQRQKPKNNNKGMCVVVLVVFLFFLI